MTINEMSWIEITILVYHCQNMIKIKGIEVCANQQFNTNIIY